MIKSTKYNYDATIDLLKKVASTTQIITRSELMQVFFGHITADSKEMNRFFSAIHTLRNGKLKKVGIGLEAHNKAEEYKVYYFETHDVAPIKTNTSVQALEKDNQKLFLELEELKKSYDALKQEYSETVRREASYKALVQTYHALTMGV